MKKKGNLPDVVWIIAVLFATAIMIIFVYYIWSQAKPELDSALGSSLPAGETSFNITQMTGDVGGGIKTFNSMISLFLLGLIVMTLISAFFIQSHPVFFFVSFLFLIIVLIIAVVFSNMYQSIIESEGISDISSEFGIMNLFMQYLPHIIVIITIIVGVILFAKPRGASTSGI